MTPLRHWMLELRVARRTVHAAATRGGTTMWAAEAAYESPGELSELIARLAGECGIHCRSAHVAVGHPPVQLRTLTDIPPVDDRQLAALVAHQSTRFFRRNGAPLVTDAVWVTEPGGRVARAAALEEPLVEAIAAGARAAGLRLHTITVADVALPLALLPEAERAARLRAAHRRVRALSVAAAGIWLVVSVLWVARLLWERRLVDREWARLQAPLAAVLAARREVHDVEAALAGIRRVGEGRARALAFLAGVTTALPDSAVLTSLTWQADGSPALSGAARRATAVLARLEHVPAPVAPTFEGPVVREVQRAREWERFTIVWPTDAHRQEHTP